MNITKTQLKQALMAWEAQARSGELMPIDEARALPIEECCERSAEHLWALLAEVGAEA